MRQRWSTAVRVRRPAVIWRRRSDCRFSPRPAASHNPQTAFNPRSEYADRGPRPVRAHRWSWAWSSACWSKAVLIWAAIRYRRRPNDALPPQIHGNTIVEVVWTTGAGHHRRLHPVRDPAGHLRRPRRPRPRARWTSNVIGHQFWWEFQYPDSPNVVTANELHLPMGQTANLILQSDDVIHSFWIPALGGKRDAFPAHTNYIWMTPNSLGEFPGQCYQLCGYSHGNMRERAIIQSPADFQAWLTAQQQPAVHADGRRRRRGRTAVPDARLHRLPHDQRHAGAGQGRAEPDPFRQPRHAGRAASSTTRRITCAPG